MAINGKERPKQVAIDKWTKRLIDKWTKRLIDNKAVAIIDKGNQEMTDSDRAETFIDDSNEGSDNGGTMAVTVVGQLETLVEKILEFHIQ